MRLSAVNSGSTSASTSFSRNACSYCCSPRPWSHAAMSTLCSPATTAARANRSPNVGGREYSSQLVGHAANHAAKAGVIGLLLGRALRQAGTLARSSRGRLRVKGGGSAYARMLQHCPISRPSASATVGGVRLKPSTDRARGGRLCRQSLRRPRARAGFLEARAPIDRSHQENNPSTVRISSQRDRKRWVRLAVTGRVIGR